MGICRPSANLLTLPMQPPNTPCKAHLHSFQYHPAIFAGQSCAGRVRMGTDGATGVVVVAAEADFGGSSGAFATARS